jgi:hypothetical protein
MKSLYSNAVPAELLMHLLSCTLALLSAPWRLLIARPTRSRSWPAARMLLLLLLLPPAEAGSSSRYARDTDARRVSVQNYDFMVCYTLTLANHRVGLHAARLDVTGRAITCCYQHACETTDQDTMMRAILLQLS